MQEAGVYDPMEQAGHANMIGVERVLIIVEDFLKQKRGILEKCGEGHDGKHGLCVICAQIILLDKLLEEVKE